MPITSAGLGGPGRDFVRIDPADGHPDGVTVDAAGNVWVGIWGGFCVRCYGPNGALLRQVDLPAENVTKVALGGPELKTAFVTRITSYNVCYTKLLRTQHGRGIAVPARSDLNVARSSALDVARRIEAR